MFGLAAQTPYDLRFRIAGIPVRVHPLFWLVMAVLSNQNDYLKGVLLFIGCAFVSILVHELGHGLSSRAFGFPPAEIVLYGMGGYCVCHLERQRPWQRLVVLLSGPGAGFLLAVPFAVIRNGSGYHDLSSSAFLIVDAMYFINVAWGVVNLFPIWPLDGGRAFEVILVMLRRRESARWMHIVSLLTAGGFALLFFQWRDTFAGIWFAYFAFTNYQALQALHYQSRYGGQEDDWWRR
jgi:Zn-dependent protease